MPRKMTNWSHPRCVREEMQRVSESAPINAALRNSPGTRDVPRTLVAIDDRVGGMGEPANVTTVERASGAASQTQTSSKWAGETRR